jgi:hypothetical protein
MSDPAQENGAASLTRVEHALPGEPHHDL